MSEDVIFDELIAAARAAVYETEAAYNQLKAEGVGLSRDGVENLRLYEERERLALAALGCYVLEQDEVKEGTEIGERASHPILTEDREVTQMRSAVLALRERLLKTLEYAQKNQEWTLTAQDMASRAIGRQAQQAKDSEEADTP